MGAAGRGAEEEAAHLPHRGRDLRGRARRDRLAPQGRGRRRRRARGSASWSVSGAVVNYVIVCL